MNSACSDTANPPLHGSSSVLLPPGAHAAQCQGHTPGAPFPVFSLWDSSFTFHPGSVLWFFWPKPQKWVLTPCGLLIHFSHLPGKPGFVPTVEPSDGGCQALLEFVVLSEKGRLCHTRGHAPFPSSTIVLPWLCSPFPPFFVFP